MNMARPRIVRLIQRECTMATLRQEIAELKKRMLALESRQLAWRYDAAASASPEAGASYSGPAYELTDEMRASLDTLWQRSVEYAQPYDQVSITPLDGATITATAYFKDGTDTYVSFTKPPDFDASACRRAMETHLNVPR
jgi:hypothetical protein